MLMLDTRFIYIGMKYGTYMHAIHACMVVDMKYN